MVFRHARPRVTPTKWTTDGIESRNQNAGQRATSALIECHKGSIEPLFSGLETEGMKRIGCSLCLQPCDQRQARVKKLQPCRVNVPQDRGETKRVQFKGCTILQVNPLAGTPVFPQILTIGGPCLYTKQDQKDFKAMMRTAEQSRAMGLPKNGDHDWPDSRAFETCPCCGNQASPGNDNEYWLLFQPLTQQKTQGLAFRSIGRLTCPDCFEDLIEGMTISATTVGSQEIQEFPLIDVVEDAGPITWLPFATTMKQRDFSVLMDAYELYIAWEVSGTWQALCNDFYDMYQGMLTSHGYKVNTVVGRKDGFTPKAERFDSEETPTTWTTKRESKLGKQCDGPGCDHFHRQKVHVDGKMKKIKLAECSACLMKLYCSKECQENDWQEHRTDCKKKQEEIKKEAEESKAKMEREAEATREAVLASFVPLSIAPQGGGGKKKKKGTGKGKKKKGKK